ncbi:cell envelope integrity protein CreD [Chitinimonas lacunae]|uniref:Cell envelope integrity protein CreD n=1 Tax=Chitinimonas lacunae TaxID=1963018 RepID=A0ABV8MR97_9NEIS
MMGKSVIWKLVAVGVLALLLLIPLAMVGGVVDQRGMQREQAVRNVAEGAAGEQVLAGPVLVLPYRQLETVKDREGGVREEWRRRHTAILPSKLAAGGTLSTFTRQLGIYPVRLYGAEVKLTGLFEIPSRDSLVQGVQSGQIEWGQPYLAIGIRDVRGIKTSPVLQWGSATSPFMPGTNFKPLGGGIRAMLPQSDGAAQTVPFSFRLSLDGMESFKLLPVGRDTEMSLNSPWPHPNFIGGFLPEERRMSDAGFSARWRTSWFASNMRERFDQCLAGECNEFNATQLGVKLIDPIDAYAQTDRAVKYGFLFVFLTFCTFFLTEVLKRVAIHPVQYGLVGLSLALFFLLLLSLSEHFPFVYAYLVAAAACVLQNGIYARYALGSLMRGLAFAGQLAVLYGLLFALLCSEDHALLLGSLLLFGVLTAVMMLTRKLDWYRLEPAKVQEEH